MSVYLLHLNTYSVYSSFSSVCLSVCLLIYKPNPSCLGTEWRGRGGPLPTSRLCDSGCLLYTRPARLFGRLPHMEKVNWNEGDVKSEQVPCQSHNCRHHIFVLFLELLLFNCFSFQNIVYFHHILKKNIV